MVKPLSVLASLLLGLISVSPTPLPTHRPPTSASFVTQLQKQIKNLQDQIVGLKFQLKEQKIRTEFPRQLHRGLSGDDVKNLQQILGSMPGVYPDALVTGYFGQKTKLAVKRFQSNSGLEASGVIDEVTRSKLADYPNLNNTTDGQNITASGSDVFALPDTATSSYNNQDDNQDTGTANNSADPNTDNINIDIPNIPDESVPIDSTTTLSPPTPTPTPLTTILPTPPTPTPSPTNTPKKNGK